MNFISYIKQLPIDLGQGERKHNTAAKNISYDFISNSINKKALDIGSRDGYWSEKLKQKGYKVLSTDINPNHSKDVVFCDLEFGLPFKDNTFDLIWCTEVIEHLNNVELLIKEIERVIKPYGTAILTTPNSSCWFYYIFKILGYPPSRLQNPDHKQFFNIEYIKEIAEGYDLFGYFPYVYKSFRIRHFVSLLSPSFILIKRF